MEAPNDIQRQRNQLRRRRPQTARTQRGVSVPVSRTNGIRRRRRVQIRRERAPHFGRLWEAVVKSAKHLIVRAMANVLLTAEDLGTLLSEVEAILKSRPLAPLNQDPNDGEALTPAHLLIGCSLRALPPA